MLCGNSCKQKRGERLGGGVSVVVLSLSRSIISVSLIVGPKQSIPPLVGSYSASQVRMWDLVPCAHAHFLL